MNIQYNFHFLIILKEGGIWEQIVVFKILSFFCLKIVQFC